MKVPGVSGCTFCNFKYKKVCLKEKYCNIEEQIYILSCRGISNQDLSLPFRPYLIALTCSLTSLTSLNRNLKEIIQQALNRHKLKNLTAVSITKP